MNGLARFFTLGARDADRRVAALLAPRSFEHADRYLMSAATIAFVDRLTHRLQEWWFASEAARAATTVCDTWSCEGWPARYQAIGTMLVTATVVHAALTLIQGPRPGWFWMIIPGTAIAFGILLLIASRSPIAKGLADRSRSPD